MIIYNVIGKNGRIGNQLFQIASTIGIAIENNHDFCFNDFEIFKYLPNLQTKLQSEKYKNAQTYYENDFCYEPVKINNNENKIIHGYFQSFKYFDKNNEKIIKYLTIENPLGDGKIDYLKNFNTCSVHIRRGDYVEIAQTNPLNPHPIQPKEYYFEAINKIQAEKYLFFSDDIEWCKQNFQNEKFIFIENKNKSFENDLYELQMMSTCQNNIIANSSYSWWAAYLNTNKDKIVIAPKNWFGEKYLKTITVNASIHDSLIPQNWIII